MTIHSARLHTLATLATNAAQNWPAYEATEAALALPATPGTGSGLGRSNTVPDPTFTIAQSHTRYFAAVTMIETAQNLIRELQAQMAIVTAQNRNTYELVSTAIRNARCSGEINPLCTDNAVQAGLCWRCYQARRRYGLQAAQERARRP